MIDSCLFLLTTYSLVSLVSSFFLYSFLSQSCHCLIHYEQDLVELFFISKIALIKGYFILNTRSYTNYILYEQHIKTLGMERGDQ